MIKVIINIFINIIFKIIELCCSFCHFLNLHYCHKVLSINDEESLKKENIEIESSAKEFNDNINKVINIKNKIEKEIIEIDKLFEKVKEETTNSFNQKREKLNKEENELKENLQNEVTKVKEQLELFLSKSNNLIKIGEKINKGIKALEKEEKKMIKTLTYVSNINKSQKEMKVLFQELMKNLKISFKEEEKKILFDEYYFNGIQTPKEIEFKDVSTNSFKFLWKIDDIKNLEVENKQIKFIVEIKKEKSNEKFQKIYEGNETNYSVENLDKNMNYEIRICSIYKDIISNWTEVKKIKTNNFDSLILRESNREKEFLKKILEWTGFKNIDLIFRGSRDGMTCNDFHKKCDNQGPTITLIKNDKGYIFGGYTSVSWTGDGNYHSDPKSFLFTLTNINGTEPTKCQISSTGNSVYHDNNYGPTFGGGHDIYINPDFINKNSYANFPSSYKDIIGKGNSTFSGNFSNYYFKLNEIEIFKYFIIIILLIII